MTDLGACRQRGFGFLDLMITLVVAALLAAVAVPTYSSFVDRAKVARAIGDIGSISVAIESFRLRNEDQLPNSLADLPIDVPLDPWGKPYAFVNIIDAGPGKGGFRKDGRLNPLNTDFDLYSRGKDGDSAGPRTAGPRAVGQPAGPLAVEVRRIPARRADLRLGPHRLGPGPGLPFSSPHQIPLGGTFRYPSFFRGHQ